MSVRNPSRIWLLLALLAAAPTALADAAEVKKQCGAAYVDAQKLRKDGSLVSAREKLIACGRDECAAAIKNECAAWLSEVNASIPTFVVVAKDKDGNETLALKVYVDDELVKDGLDAKAIEVDPGTHKLRLELEGADPIEQELVLQEGRKNRIVEVSWQKDAPAAPATAEPDEEIPPDRPLEKPGPPVVSYVLAGVGVLALGGTAYFWLTAASEKSDLDACKPACDQADVDAVEQKRLFGDIALGVGVVSLGAAAYFWFSQPGAPPPAESARAPRFDLQARPGGAFASVRGAF
jgi:hypothetical protein